MIDYSKYSEEGKLICNTYLFYKDLKQNYKAYFYENEKMENYLSECDEMAECILSSLDAPESCYFMDPDCFEQIRENFEKTNERPASISLIYRTCDNSKAIYLLYITLNIMPEDNHKYDMHSSFFRCLNNNKTIEKYDQENNEWIFDENLDLVFQYRNNSTAKSFLYGIEDYSRFSVYLLDNKKIVEILIKNKPLIDLADSLNETGRLKVLLRYHFDGNNYIEDSISMVLTANDPMRHGTAVLYQDKKFVLYKTDDGNTEGRNSLVFDTSNKTFIFDKICETENSEALKNILIKMWDHYNCESAWYTVPLSLTAWYSCKMDGIDEGKTYTTIDQYNKTRELTGKEKNELGLIKEWSKINYEKANKKYEDLLQKI